MNRVDQVHHRANKTIIHILVGQFTALIFVILGIVGFQQYRIKEIHIETRYKTVLDLRTGLSVNEELKIFLVSSPELVYEFYDGYTRNREVTEAIIQIAIEKNVPVNRAFGIAYAESEFNPRAVNGRHNANGTRDWGLFQLNDGHRPSWSQEDFFNIRANAREGLSYFKQCIETYDGIVAVAAYNRGISGVREGVSMAVLLYVNKVLRFEEALDRAVNKALFE